MSGRRAAGAESTDEVPAAVGPGPRRIRGERAVTLAALSETAGIPVSTLSRLESGLRRPGPELLLPIAQAHRVPPDDLVGAPAVGDRAAGGAQASAGAGGAAVRGGGVSVSVPRHLFPDRQATA